MCWLAVKASHSTGLSHLQGRQANSLTLCVPLSPFRGRQQQQKLCMKKKKKKLQEVHKNMLEPSENKMCISSLQQPSTNLKHNLLLLSRCKSLFIMHIDIKHNKVPVEKRHDVFWSNELTLVSRQSVCQCSVCGDRTAYLRLINVKKTHTQSC